jgi:hypothetical protein
MHGTKIKIKKIYFSSFKRPATESYEFVMCEATAKQTLAEKGLGRCAVMDTMWAQR